MYEQVAVVSVLRDELGPINLSRTSESIFNIKHLFDMNNSDKRKIKRVDVYFLRK